MKLNVTAKIQGSASAMFPPTHFFASFRVIKMEAPMPRWASCSPALPPRALEREQTFAKYVIRAMLYSVKVSKPSQNT